MSLCINPHCPQPANSDHVLFCQSCGSELLILGRYRVVKLLSHQTGFGQIYEVQEKGTGVLKILKVLTQNLPKAIEPKAIELFQQEAQILTQLDHPGIPKGEGYFTFHPRTSTEPLHCLVMQKIEGMNLEQYIIQRGNPIDQRTALNWLKEITEILQVIHQQNLFHRDIKPSNVMLTPEGNLVLIDFGAARQVSASYLAKAAAGQMITKIGSPGFIPPEQERGHAELRSDFFALGRTFVYLLTGKPPSEFSEDPTTGNLHWKDTVPHIAPQLVELIDRLMQHLPAHRPANSQEILQQVTDLEALLYSPPPKKEPSVPPSPSQPPASSLSGDDVGIVVGLGVVFAIAGAFILGFIFNSTVNDMFRDVAQEAADHIRPDPSRELPYVISYIPTPLQVLLVLSATTIGWTIGSILSLIFLWGKLSSK